MFTTIAEGTALAIERARTTVDQQENLERLQDTQAQVMQADKLQALGTLLSGLAHELNNPLSTIQLSVQLMKRNQSLPENVRKRMDAMEDECDRASRIIRDMLAGYVERGSTVFLTSHVLDVVEKLCTHVGIIAKGKLVEQASLEDIRQGSSLEQRFLEKVGADEDATQKLSWLEEAT